MAKIAGLEYVTYEFDKKGTRINAGPVIPAGITDLIVISHGWHSDADDSQELYEELIGNVVKVKDWGKGKTFAVAGVFWPSDKYRDDLGQETRNVLGGAAASAGGHLADAVLVKIAGEIQTFLKIRDPAFTKKVLRAAGGGKDADDLMDILRASVTDGPVDEETAIQHAELMSKKKGHEILSQLQQQGTPALANQVVATGGGATSMGAGTSAAGGSAAGLFSGAKAGIAKLLNQVAYFELKKRSGRIGEKLGELLNAAPGIKNIRLHLVGHSFGARLVTSAANVLDDPAQSMTLLQAAFSHNSFAEDADYGLNKNIRGGFRDVIVKKKIRGPVAITHTWNDRAVGLAYPSASRISQSVANGIGVSNGFGGPGDAYGGLGANGALHLSAAEGSDVTYDGKSKLSLTPGHFNSLKCDFIQSHTDVAKMEVAQVVAAATS